jgi:hypothetical protein
MDETQDDIPRQCHSALSNETRAASTPLGYESSHDRIVRNPPTGFMTRALVLAVGFLATAVPIVLASRTIFVGTPESFGRRITLIASLGLGDVLIAAMLVVLTTIAKTSRRRILGRWLVFGMLLGVSVSLVFA